MMIDPDVPLRVGNSGPEYNNHTPGRHWPGCFVRLREVSGAMPVQSASNGRKSSGGVLTGRDPAVLPTCSE